jgi:hypothetical protein
MSGWGWGWRRGISGFSGVVWRECTLLQSCITLCSTCKWMVTTFFAQEICNSRDWLHPLRLRSSLAAMDAAPATYTQTQQLGTTTMGTTYNPPLIFRILCSGNWVLVTSSRAVDNCCCYTPQCSWVQQASTDFPVSYALAIGFLSQGPPESIGSCYKCNNTAS